MNILNQRRHTFTLSRENNGTYETVKSEASFAELAAYSHIKIKEAVERSNIWWLDGFRNQPYAFYSGDKSNVLRVWVGLVDGNDNGRIVT